MPAEVKDLSCPRTRVQEITGISTCAQAGRASNEMLRFCSTLVAAAALALGRCRLRARRLRRRRRDARQGERRQGAAAPRCACSTSSAAPTASASCATTAACATPPRATSRLMVSGRFFSHDAPNGSTPLSRIRHTHYLSGARCWTIGENLAWGTGRLATPRATVRAWMHSPGHRANILNGSFREIGIGIATGAPVRGSAASPRRPPTRRTSATAANLRRPMADVQPLEALHYDQAVAGPLQQLVAPPYDVIDAEQRAELAARSPYNVVRVDLPEGDDPYAEAARLSAQWQEQGAIVAGRARLLGARPGLHRPRRAQADPPRHLRARARDGVRPGQDPPARAHAPRPEGGPPAAHAGDEGEPQPDLQPLRRPAPAGVGRRWSRTRRASPTARRPTTTAPSTACGASTTRPRSRRSTQALEPTELLIADGHHRYETARVYADEIGGEGPHRYVLMCLVALQDDGPHRLPHPPPAHGRQGPRHARSSSASGCASCSTSSRSSSRS